MTGTYIYPHMRGSIDDMGDGKYDYMGVAVRVPLHADKAEQFLAVDDVFNASQHAKTVLALGATGWIGTPPYVRAEAVLATLRGRGERV